MKGTLQKQTIILLFSMVMAILLVFTSVAYSYTVVNINNKDENKVISLKSAVIDLKLQQSDKNDKLALCKSYPIKDEVGLSDECSAFTFTLTNQNNTPVSYYLNLEVDNNSTLAEKDLKVAFASCGSDGSLCPDDSYDYYSIGNLSQMLRTTDVVNSNARGYILSAGENFAKNDVNTYKIILWQDYASTTEFKKVILSVTATSYVPSKSDIVFTTIYNLNNFGAWGESGCSGDGFSINTSTNECIRTLDIKKSYETIPKPIRDGYALVGFYSVPGKTGGLENKIDSKYNMLNNQVFYARWLDAIAPTCTVTKVSGVGSTSGVNVKVTCSDSGSGCVEEEHSYNNVKGTTTYKVYDQDGNMGTCKVTIRQEDGDCVDYDHDEYGGLYCKHYAHHYY